MMTLIAKVRRLHARNVKHRYGVRNAGVGNHSLNVRRAGTGRYSCNACPPVFVFKWGEN